MIELSLLTFPPLLYEYGRDGTGATDEDLKAWARNNPGATKIDLAGLTSLTSDGIAEVVKMLPRLATFIFEGCVRRARYSPARGADLRGRVCGTRPGVLNST